MLGKSTLLLSLMNLVPTSRGAISIDGVPLTSFSKAVLKKIIGVLPQSPAVQKGWTVRRSLDPQGEFKEESLLAVLQSVGLGKTVAALPSGLDTVIIHDEFEEMRLTELLTVGAGEPLPSRQLSGKDVSITQLTEMLQIHNCDSSLWLGSHCRPVNIGLFWWTNHHQDR